MQKTLHYKYDELTIDLNEIIRVMGYETGVLPEPFDAYLEEAVDVARKLSDIQAVYLIKDDIGISEVEKKIFAGGKEFITSKTICKELKGSEHLVFFVCTAGETISSISASLLKGENPVLGYVYDLLGSAIVEAVGDEIQKLLKLEFKSKDYKITNRYSPGYCHWNVEEQHKLFSLFEGSPCGVSLTASALMHPIKSISGIMGLGVDVRFREYPCDLCSSTNCIYRKLRARKRMS